MRKSTVNNLHIKHILFSSKKILVSFPNGRSTGTARDPENYVVMPLIIPNSRGLQVGFLNCFKCRIVTPNFSYRFTT